MPTFAARVEVPAEREVVRHEMSDAQLHAVPLRLRLHTLSGQMTAKILSFVHTIGSLCMCEARILLTKANGGRMR